MHLTDMKHLFAFVCFLAAFASVSAQLFYRITPPGGQASYLLGTMHLVPEDRLQFSPAVEDALAGSQVLYLEVDPDIPLSEQVALASKVMMDPPLQERVTPELYARLEQEARAIGVKPKKFARLGRLMPLFMVPAVLQMGLDDVVAVDLELRDAANKQKKLINGLETLAFQMDLMRSFSLEDQLAMLQDPDVFGKAAFEQMVDLYFAEDLEGLRKMTEKEMIDLPDFNRRLLDDRNRSWIPIMSKSSAVLPAFYAVGAAHLPGPAGVLALLRDAGWQVETMPPAFVR